jgi:hypothetical protein
VDLLTLPSLQTNCDPSQWDIPAFLPEQGTTPDQPVMGNNNRVNKMILIMLGYPELF